MAATNLRCSCINDALDGDGLSWGEWTETCTDGIVAIQTRVVKIQIGGDNTALSTTLDSPAARPIDLRL